MMKLGSRKLMSQRGQALVLVLLSLAVVLTLVLFVLARSTTDIAVSSRNEEAARAFSAAEAGVENSLVIGIGGTGDFQNGAATYTANVSNFAEGATEFNYPILLSSGDTMTVWFASHSDNGELIPQPFNIMNVCWGNLGIAADDSSPAVEVSVFYETTVGDPGTTQIARVTFDPFGGRSFPNSFSSAGGACSVAGEGYDFQGTVNLASLPGVNTNGLLFARVRMFYNNDPQPVGVSVNGPNPLPSQGQDISSTGSAGDSNRKVSVFQGWPEVPPVFDYAIYSGGGLTK